MWIFRLGCLAYGVLLTMLLEVPDPAALLGWRTIPRIAGGIGVHFTAFCVLGFLVAASRFPLRRWWIAGLLLSYAFASELVQYFVPPRTVELRDLLENLAGLSVGVGLWQLIAWYRTPTRREDMTPKEQFRILTPEGLVTYDTFSIAEKQPLAIRPGCVLVVDTATGRRVTVHRARLVLVQDLVVLNVDQQRKSPCTKCGKVEGVVDDEVVCPNHAQGVCGLLDAEPAPQQVLTPEHSR